MTLADILKATKWRCYQVLRKLIKTRSSKNNNKVSPIRQISVNGTVDASEEITMHTFCACTTSYLPFPIREESTISIYENVNASYDSAYDTLSSNLSMVVSIDRKSSICEDANSITTEMTWLEYDLNENEQFQNLWNETVETIASTR